MDISIFCLLLAIFLFFRYVRANKSILLCFVSLASLCISVYFSKNNTSILLFIVAVIIFEIFIAILKERKNLSILKIQAGYKPAETIYHYIIFAIVTFVIAILIIK